MITDNAGCVNLTAFVYSLTYIQFHAGFLLRPKDRFLDVPQMRYLSKPPKCDLWHGDCTEETSCVARRLYRNRVSSGTKVVPRVAVFRHAICTVRYGSLPTSHLHSVPKAGSSSARSSSVKPSNSIDAVECFARASYALTSSRR